MRRFNITLPLLYVTLFLGFESTELRAQSVFSEGILMYRADTIKRIEPFPASYIFSQVIIYKKSDNLRIETWRVYKSNKNHFEKDIHIRNKEGVYRFTESSDTTMSEFANFALFMSYEDERLFQAERALKGPSDGYTVNKVIQKLRWLDLPAQRVLVKGGPNNEESEMILTNALDIPSSLIFDFSLGRLTATPLQFVISELGWMTRFKAVKLRPQKVSDSLFEINPKFKIMSFEEMVQGIIDFK